MFISLTFAFLIFMSFIIYLFQCSGIPVWNSIFKACALSNFSSCADSYPMSVHVIDVGKADSIFLTCEGKNILIDAGETDIYDVVNEYLRKLNVKTNY